MGTKDGEKNVGPGSYHSVKVGERGNRGMFSKTNRNTKPSKVPGPAHYHQDGKFDGPTTEKDKYTLQRE